MDLLIQSRNHTKVILTELEKINNTFKDNQDNYAAALRNKHSLNAPLARLEGMQ